MIKISGKVYAKYVKRLTDIILSAAGIIITIIPMAIIAVIIKADSPGPVIFRQKRVGKGKKHFEILKFRTMRTDAPKDMPTHMLKDPESMITKTGRWLRKTSLDELPQLFNIFAGQMSIVGPRPALWNQEDLIALRDGYVREAGKTEECIQPHDSEKTGGSRIQKNEKLTVNDLRPGLTGWAQINGRDELPVDIKAEYDGEYLKNMSLGFDIKCFLKTITAVLKSEGVVEGERRQR